jgi:uncharacterized protein YjbI with pentapeptide repeats
MKADTNSSEPRVINASYILAKIERGEDFEYDGKIIKGDLYISGRKLLKEHVKRTEEEKASGLSEERKVINSQITITNSEIMGEVKLSNVSFSKPLNFTGTEFGGYANFAGAKFDEANFKSVKFGKGADFKAAKFCKDAIFGNAEFVGNAKFRSGEFVGEAKFWNVKFRANANFWNVKFGGIANFEDAEFRRNAKFWKAKFKNGNFKRALVSGEAKFSEATFTEDAEFEKAKFGKNAEFDDAEFSKNVRFNNAQFTDNANFDKTCFNGSIDLTRIKFDRLYIYWDEIKDKLTYDDTAYILLIENFRNLVFFEDADNCYFQFRTERRKKTKKKDIKTILDIPLELLYGYGVRPMRVLASSFITIIFLTVFFYGLGGIVSYGTADDAENESLNISIIDSVKFSSAVFLSGTKLFVDPPDYTNRTGVTRDSYRFLFELIFTIGRVMGALLFFMFVYAVGTTAIRRL